jgi:hypothetical protein
LKGDLFMAIYFNAAELKNASNPNFRITEITLDDGTKRTISVGKVVKAKNLYHVPGRTATLASTNMGIHVYSDWQQDKLQVFTNKDRTKIYAEIDKKYCVDSYTTFDMSIYAEEDENEWQITFSHDAPDYLRAYVVSLIAAVNMELLNKTVKDYDGSTRDNNHEFFCDAINSGFCSVKDICLVTTNADDVAEKFALADLSPLFSSVEAATETELDVPIENYFTWESCLKGEHRLDYEWAPEAVGHIPPLSTLDKFVPTKEFISMLVLVEQSLGKINKRMSDGLTGEDALGEDAVNLKLSGPPGSGKSFALKCLAAVLGMPFWVTSFNPNSDESFAEGKTRMVGSEPRHTDAPLTMCQMYGGISAGEEPNTGDPEMIFGVYSQIVESPYTLYRNGCEAVIRHPLSVYAILYNKNCGSATMHAALLNRFNQPFKFKPADKDEFIGMLLKRSESKKTSATEDIDKFYNEFAARRKSLRKTPRMICEWIFKAYNSVMNSLDSSSGRDAAEAISLRSCYGVLQSINNGEDPISALRSLTDNVGDFDEELEEATTKALQSSLPRL